MQGTISYVSQCVIISIRTLSSHFNFVVDPSEGSSRLATPLLQDDMIRVIFCFLFVFVWNEIIIIGNHFFKCLLLRLVFKNCLMYKTMNHCFSIFYSDIIILILVNFFLFHLLYSFFGRRNTISFLLANNNSINLWLFIFWKIPWYIEFNFIEYSLTILRTNFDLK